MIEFKLFGIPVRVEPWFWITLAFVSGRWNIQSSTGIMMFVLFLLAGFLSILIHEFGHALMIKKYGLPTQVVLSNFGGYATMPAGRLSRVQSFLVTAAGPAVQIVVGLLMFGFIISMLDGHLSIIELFLLPSSKIPPIQLFMVDFTRVSIFWAVINCVPIYPLDGGQMLGSILGPKRGKLLHIIGMVIAGGVALYGLSAGSFLMVAFMGFFAYQNFQFYKNSPS